VERLRTRFRSERMELYLQGVAKILFGRDIAMRGN
jgi:hypothetical protein